MTVIRREGHDLLIWFVVMQKSMRLINSIWHPGSRLPQHTGGQRSARPTKTLRDAVTGYKVHRETSTESRLYHAQAGTEAIGGSVVGDGLRPGRHGLFLTIEPRLLKSTSSPRIGTHARTIIARMRNPIWWMAKGTIRIATRFMTLIIGLMAGPAVSLNGSPIVLPMTEALWQSVPLPPNQLSLRVRRRAQSKARGRRRGPWGELFAAGL